MWILAGCMSVRMTVVSFGYRASNSQKSKRLSSLIIFVRHVTGNDEDYLRKILRVVVQKSALL